MEVIFRLRCRLEKKGHGVNTVTLFLFRYVFVRLFFRIQMPAAK